uniref:Uncharacterized protein n=1 Tax=Anopheles epiroticus TaxID=199890 RepID=A0A182PAB7_9DIPT
MATDGYTDAMDAGPRSSNTIIDNTVIIIVSVGGVAHSLLLVAVIAIRGVKQLLPCLTSSPMICLITVRSRVDGASSSYGREEYLSMSEVRMIRF